jgi:hypothetical protein
MAGRSDFDRIGYGSWKKIDRSIDRDQSIDDRSTDRDPARSISFFKILFGSILVKIWAFKKGQIQISQKMPLPKLYENLVWVFILFFSKNQLKAVKSVEEYNFNLFWFSSQFSIIDRVPKKDRSKLQYDRDRNPNRSAISTAET